MIRRLRPWLHDRVRAHYYFEQNTTAFTICARRVRWQRPTEYVVAWNDHAPVSVTREQFVNLDARLRAEAVAALDDVLDLLEPFESEEDDSE